MAAVAKKKTDRKVLKILSSENRVAVINKLINSISDTLKVSDIETLSNVFLQYFNPSFMKKDEEEKNTSVSEEEKVAIRQSFKLFTNVLVKNLNNTNDPVCLNNILMCMKIEMLWNNQNSTGISADGKINFPNHIWISVIEELLKSGQSNSLLVQFVIEHQKYFDIRFYTLKNIASLMRASNVNKFPCNIETSSILEILLGNSSKYIGEEEDNDVLLYFESFIDDSTDVSNLIKTMKNVVNNAWLSFLSYKKHENTVLKKILINIDTFIIPSLLDPKLLIDFLTDAYNLGGVYSLLSLNGLFTLLNEYNLDYPNFYSKLYQLLSPNLFYVKYRARFFYLLDLFLSSTHLPSYLIMAFTKKLARLTLFAPIEVIDMLLLFIQNMLIRHPSSQILIHQKNVSKASLKNDPYNYEEEDPSKCLANESCLWELSALKTHYSHATIKNVTSFEKELPKVEHDLSEYFDLSYDELAAEKYNASDKENVPRNYTTGNEVFMGLKEDMWVLE